MTAENRLLQLLTSEHYDKYHFDFDSEGRKEWLTRESLLGRAISERLDGVERVYDVGCGTGLISSLIHETSGRWPFSIDLSLMTLRESRKKGLSRLLCASNLALPLKDSSGGFVLSHGVIHHTPDPYRSFEELIRITKPGEILYVSVYNKFSLYRLIYLLGGPLRWYRMKNGPDAPIIILFMPLFYLYLLLGIFLVTKKVKILPWKMAWNIFNDHLMTPQATFHSIREIQKWGQEKKLLLIEKRKEGMGSMISFLFRKQS